MANALEHLNNRTKLEWSSKLNTEFTPARNYRRTSIIGTIGMLTLDFALLRLIVRVKKCYRMLITDFFYLTGPKTNSVEKISMLRTGTEQPQSQ